MEKYFAEKSELGDLLDKIDDYYQQLDSIGHLRRIARSYAQYYGRGYDSKSDEIIAGGDAGEESRISINKYRTYLRSVLSLIISDRPAIKATPINTDYKNTASALVGEQVLDYYMKSKMLEDTIIKAMEKAVWSSEGFVMMQWDAEAGEFFSADPDHNNKAIMTGDIKYETYSADLVCRDIYQTNPDWYVVIDTANKWDLIARYPEHKDEILNSSDMIAGKYQYYSQAKRDTNNEDRVVFYTFFHKKTPAMPKGKMVLFTDKVKIMSTDLPYSEVPVYRVSAADLHGTNLGYTQGFDALGAQEVSDEIYSANVSNNITFSRQCITIPRNADMNFRDLAAGLSVIEVDTPEDARAIGAVQLTQSSPESYNMLDRMDKEMERITGINEVVKGEPGPNVRSGTSMALLSAQAIKFNSTLQQSYIKLIEDLGTATLVFLQDFAEMPRYAQVVDKSQRSYLKEFSKNDLLGVSRVQCEVVSSFSKSSAGRIEIANALLEKGMIKRPEQYISVINTGKLEPVIGAEQSELMNIQAENELMADSGSPEVILTDNHAMHIREHRTVLDNPESRTNPEVVQSVLAHIQEHINIWSQADPNVLAATGQMPMQAPPPPPPGAGPEGLPEAMNEGPQEPEAPNTGMPPLPEGATEEDVAAYEQMQPPSL